MGSQKTTGTNEDTPLPTQGLEWHTFVLKAIPLFYNLQDRLRITCTRGNIIIIIIKYIKRHLY